MPKQKKQKEMMPEQFLTSKTEQWQKLGVIIDYVGGDPRLGGRAAYSQMLQALKRGASTDELKELAMKGIQGHGEILACQDVIHFLETGHALVPLNILDLGGYLKEQANKAWKERQEEAKRLRQHEKDIDVRQAEEKRQAARAKLASETGISPEALEKLAESKPAG